MFRDHSNLYIPTYTCCMLMLTNIYLLRLDTIETEMENQTRLLPKGGHKEEILDELPTRQLKINRNLTIGTSSKKNKEFL